VAAFFEPEGPRPVDPLAAIVRCIEQGAGGLLFDGDALPAAFFDLSTGVAGELAQKLVNYGLRMAVVVPDLERHSPHFRDFAREANRGRQLRFLPTRGEAVGWLMDRSAA
jgi:hypothetical protein